MISQISSTGNDGSISPAERVKQLTGLTERVAELKADLRSTEQARDKSLEEIKNIGTHLLLIADEDLSHKFTLAVDRIKITGHVRSAEIDALQRAARKELGVSDGRIRKLRNISHRRFAAWKLRKARGNREH